MTPRQARVALGTFVLLAAGVTGNALYLQGDVDRAAVRPAAPPPPRAEPQRPSAPPAEPKPKVGKTSQHAAVLPPAETPKTVRPQEPPPDRPAGQRQAEPDAQPVEPAGQGQTKSAQAVKVRVVRVATIGDAPPEDTDPETVRAVQGELNRLGYGPVAADGAIRPELRAAIMAFEHEHRLPLTGEATQALLKQLLFGAPASPGTAGASDARSPHAQAMIRQVQQMLADRGYRPGAVDGRFSAETVAAIRSFEVDQGLVPKGRISVTLLERLESGMGGGGRHRAP